MLVLENIIYNFTTSGRALRFDHDSSKERKKIMHVSFMRIFTYQEPTQASGKYPIKTENKHGPKDLKDK